MSERDKELWKAISEGITKAQASKDLPPVPFTADPTKPFEAAIHHSQDLLAGLKQLADLPRSRLRFTAERDFNFTSYRIVLNDIYVDDRGREENKILQVFPNGRITAQMDQGRMLEFQAGAVSNNSFDVIKLVAQHAAQSNLIPVSTPAPTTQAANVNTDGAKPAGSGFGKMLRRAFGG